MPDKIRLGISENNEPELEYFSEKLPTFPDINLVWTATSPDEMLEKVQSIATDIVLFDLHYHGWAQDSVWGILHQAIENSPYTRFLGYTAHSDLSIKALEAGCAGVLHKGTGVKVSQVHSEIARLAKSAGEKKLSWKAIGVSVKELEAFRAYLITGSSQKAADRRHVVINTQRNQEQSLRGKLESATGEAIESMPTAVTIAMRYHLISNKDFNVR